MGEAPEEQEAVRSEPEKPKVRTEMSGMKKASYAKRASFGQVRFFKAMFAHAGLELAPTRLRRFQGLSVGEASLEIERVQTELKVLAVVAYVAPAGLATAKQLHYLVGVRRRLNEPVLPEELEQLKKLTTMEMQTLTLASTRRLQDHNDRMGVPVPAWRVVRGLYDAAVVREGHRAAKARKDARDDEVRARDGGRAQRFAYPGENERRRRPPRGPGI